MARAAIRKPAEVNCPAALARAGRSRAATPEEGRSAGSSGGAAVPLEPRGARAKPTAAPPCDPPEQVTGAQWGQKARGKQLKPARARATHAQDFDFALSLC